MRQIANKGKGKEREPQTKDDGDMSAVDRLQSSSRMAFKSLVSNHNLPSQGSGSKAATSSQSAHPSLVSQGESSYHRLRPPTAGESLREPLKPEALSQFDDFLQGSALEPEPEQLIHRCHQDTAIAKQEAMDGAAVLELLDAPVAFETLEDMEASDKTLSPEAAQNLHEALFSTDSHGSRWDSLLDFTPNFLGDELADPSQLQLHLGIEDPAEARRVWLHQWGDVLSSYTDHVWGDLEPLVAEARREVERLDSQNDSSNSKTSGPKALNRLRMILAHVRGQ